MNLDILNLYIYIFFSIWYWEKKYIYINNNLYRIRNKKNKYIIFIDFLIGYVYLKKYIYL
jgi:hypothetical protein